MAYCTNTASIQAEPDGPWSLARELERLGPCPSPAGVAGDADDALRQYRDYIRDRLAWSRAAHALYAHDQQLRASQSDPGAPRLIHRKAGVEVAMLSDDTGTEIRRQRDEIEGLWEGDSRINRRRVTRVAHPLERYARRGEIDRTQYRAGTRFRADYFRAQAMPGLISRYSDEPGTQRASAYMPEVYARSVAYDAAVRAVGMRQAVVLVWVCGEGRSAADYAKERGWTLAHGMGALKVALDSLIDHYGIGDE